MFGSGCHHRLVVVVRANTGVASDDGVLCCCRSLAAAVVSSSPIYTLHRVARGGGAAWGGGGGGGWRGRRGDALKRGSGGVDDCTRRVCIEWSLQPMNVFSECRPRFSGAYRVPSVFLKTFQKRLLA